MITAFILGGSVMKCAYIHKDDWIANASDHKQVRADTDSVVIADSLGTCRLLFLYTA